ncbi:MAG: hypothetical protein QXI37_04240, partial [Thermoprotei archaeon]
MTRTKPRRGIGTAAIAGIIVVIIIIAAAGGYLYYTASTKKPTTITVLVSSGSETQQYLAIVAKDFEAQHPGVKITFEPV